MEFIISIGTGLVLWSIQLLVVHTVIPWYRNLNLKAVNIAGKWNVKYSGQEGIAAKLEIDQRGNLISATGEVTKKRDGTDPESERLYVYRGRMLNDSLVVWFDDKKNPSNTGGAMAFYFPDKTNTNIIYGKSLFYKDQIIGVDMVECILEKVR
jgi:hypothetical protein